MQNQCPALAKRVAGIGNQQLACGPSQERGAELTFKSSSLWADHVLGDARTLRRGTDKAGFQDGSEVGEVTKASHGVSSRLALNGLFFGVPGVYRIGS